jgi:catechol 2,3-dioxygenase-like lactoylglutathione lyase family enzyme
MRGRMEKGKRRRALNGFIEMRLSALHRAPLGAQLIDSSHGAPKGACHPDLFPVSINMSLLAERSSCNESRTKTQVRFDEVVARISYKVRRRIFMLETKNAFSSFSVDDLQKAKRFYGQTLGLKVSESPEGLEMHPGETSVFVYPKPNHEPASFTVLNFMVDDIEAAVDELKEKGVSFEQYDGAIKTNKQGIHRGDSGPTIAWFKDPAGNILSVLQKDQ